MKIMKDSAQSLHFSARLHDHVLVGARSQSQWLQREETAPIRTFTSCMLCFFCGVVCKVKFQVVLHLSLSWTWWFFLSLNFIWTHLIHMSLLVGQLVRISCVICHFIEISLLCFEVTTCELLCLMACAMWSRGSWLGGSLVSAWCFCCFAHLLVWPCDFVFRLFCFCCHTLSRWYNAITLALISPWTGTCHTSVWLFCFGLLCFVLVVWVFSVLVFAVVFGFWWLRDRLDYVQVLYQITLEAPQSAGGHVCIN